MICNEVIELILLFIPVCWYIKILSSNLFKNPGSNNRNNNSLIGIKYEANVIDSKVPKGVSREFQIHKDTLTQAFEEQWYFKSEVLASSVYDTWSSGEPQWATSN